MTRLYFIRHGRASADKSDYDELHPQGIEQSRLLGAHLARNGQRFEAVYCGPLRRQRDTLMHMRAAAGDAVDWPPATELQALAEAPLIEMARDGLAALLQLDAEAQALVEAIGAAPDARARSKATLRMFHHGARAWLRGDWQVDGYETGGDFQRRVTDALHRMAAGHVGDTHVAVVTSNGVIGCVLDAVLGRRPEDPAYGLPALPNTSITEIEAGPDGMRVVRDKHTPHLLGSELLTLL